MGDLVSIKAPLNRTTKRILDAAGRLKNITNPLGQKTLYTPDALDRVTQMTDALNGITSFGYDANSNLLTVTDAKSQQTVHIYNNMWVRNRVRLDFPGFCGHRYTCFDTASNASGLTPLRWLCRRVRL